MDIMAADFTGGDTTIAGSTDADTGAGIITVAPIIAG